MEAGLWRLRQGYLHLPQLFPDEGMHLTPCPLQGEVILKLFQSFPGDHGDLADVQRGHAGAQLGQRLSAVVI